MSPMQKGKYTKNKHMRFRKILMPTHFLSFAMGLEIAILGRIESVSKTVRLIAGPPAHAYM